MKITIQDARTSVTLQQRDFRVTISGARGPAGPQGEPGEGGEWGTIVGDITEQTDLYTALQAKVPYTGATQDVNLGEYGAQLGNLEFDNTPTNIPTTAGSVYWNDTDGTLNLVLKGGQTISRIGETQHIRALNNTGSQIARGKVVYVVGAQGQRLTIALADADTEILSKDTIGFTAEAIADGAEGFVIVQGVINNVSTTGMTDGATVYLSQTAGGYTTTAPTDPAHLVVLGFIVNGGSGGAGSIYVKVDNGYELEELHGVADAAKVTPVGADALLLRDSEDNNLWKRLTWTNALAGVKTHMDTFKSVAGGYASLDGSGKVPSSELPSYVDDVVEVASFAALPGTGETGKIYVTLDTNKCYRWTGSVYVEVSAGGGVDTLTTTGTSGAATLVGSTLNIPQYQGVLTNPVTGTGTAGQVAYFSGTSAVTGSANLIWDNTSKNLNFGNASSSIGYSNSSRTIFFNDSNSGILYQGFGGHRFTVWNQSTYLNAIVATGNTSTPNVGIFVDAPSARLHVRGSGTTSATTALLVQNSTPTAILTVRDDGSVYINNGTLEFGTVAASNPKIFGQNGLGVLSYSSPSGISIESNLFIGSEGYDIHLRRVTGTRNVTTGTNGYLALIGGYAPTSGTGTYVFQSIAGTINQTGGANGITRGLYVNPTLTAAADWRSVEFSNNTGWGLYGAGTANNYLGGRLGLNNTALTNVTLRNSLAISGSISSYGYFTDAIITSGVTSTASYFHISPQTQNASFTLTNLNGYYVENPTIGASSTVTNVFGFYGNIASGTGRWNLYMNGTAANYLAGNTSIGTTTESARLLVRGSGTTSATTALLVQNSTPSELFKVLDNGAWNFNGDGIVTGSGNTFTTTTLNIRNSDNNSIIRFRNDNRILLGSDSASPSFAPMNRVNTGVSNVGQGLIFEVNGNSSGTDILFTGNNITISSGAISNTIYQRNFLPTSGTATLSILTVSSIINQTGGANGITRGLYVNPTLTAAADWRSIETSNNTGYAAYFAGSADLFLGNGTDIQIGTTTGTKIGTATNQLIGLWNATPIAQPTTAVAAATRVGGAGNTVTDTDTFDGYTIAQLVKALRNMGALA